MRLLKRMCVLTLSNLVAVHVGCTGKGTQTSKGSGPVGVQEGEQPPVETEAVVGDDGSAKAKLSAGATSEQTITVPNSEATASIKGVTVKFPPGALAIDTEISISEGAPIVTAGAAAALEVDGAFGATGTAVTILPETATEALQPFTVKLELPQGGALALADQIPVVVYKVQLAGGGYALGIIDQLELEPPFAKVKTTRFGTFQTVWVTKPVAAKEVATTSAPLSKRDAASLPVLTLSGRSPLVVRPGNTVTVAGTNFRPSMTLAFGGKRVGTVTVASDVSASFKAPSGAAGGKVELLAEQDGASAKIAFLYDPGTGSTPVITLPPAEVCAGVQYLDGNGAAQTGSKTCAAAVADCTGNGQTGCVTTAAFKSADLSNLAATNIKSGVTIAGVAGGVTPSPAACTSDGQITCVTTAAFPAADLAAFSAWDLRAGAQVGGVSGFVEYRKNVAKLTEFNLTTPSPPATASVDAFDTVDDELNPADVPAGFPNPAAILNWSWIDDDDNGDDCDVGEDCGRTDKITGLTWSDHQSSVLTWQNAITHCDGFTFGGYSDWRLPTQKELMLAYVNGGRSALHGIVGGLYWSSTTDPVSNSGNDANAYGLQFLNGFTSGDAKVASKNVICVRP